MGAGQTSAFRPVPDRAGYAGLSLDSSAESVLTPSLISLFTARATGASLPRLARRAARTTSLAVMGGYRPSVNEVRETVAAQRRQTTLNQYPNDLATLREAVSLQRRQASLLTQHTAEIAELRKTVQALQKQLANRNDLPASVKAAASRFASYQPAASTNCHGVLPCLHTTPGERIAAGCLEAVWDGHFGRHGTRYEPARWAGGALGFRGRISGF